MTTFVLVPGAWHGAWCWDRLIPELEGFGHRAIAVDLPCEDTSAGCAEYAAIVLDAMAAADDDAGDETGDVVLVGHSAGGLTVPLVAAARPVSRMVFVGGLLPVVGRRFVDQDADEHVLVEGYADGVRRDPDGCRSWFDRKIAGAYMYNGCTPADARWAFDRLRPQASLMYTEITPLEAWPDVPSVDIRAYDDRIVSASWGVRAARERLGIATHELGHGGHCLMLSRPAELARTLSKL